MYGGDLEVLQEGEENSISMLKFEIEDTGIGLTEEVRHACCNLSQSATSDLQLFVHRR